MSAENSPAVECRGLEYRFGEKRALAGIDLLVHRGEVFGLLGPNGAGKTTTIRVLTTLLPAPKGHAYVFGLDVHDHAMQVRRPELEPAIGAIPGSSLDMSKSRSE